MADDLQGRGVGTQLGRALTEAARARGIARFTASMLPSNQAAHRLFAKISSQLQTVHHDGVDEPSRRSPPPPERALGCAA